MLRQKVVEFLKEQKIADNNIVDVASVIVTIGIIVFSIALYNVFRRMLKSLANFISERYAQYRWLKVFADVGVFDRAAHIVPIIIMATLAESVEKYSDSIFSNVFLIKLATGYLCVITGLTLCKIFDALVVLYNKAHESSTHMRPINSYVDLLKLLVYACVGVSIITIVFDKSLVAIFSGLGALTAVIVIVFRDSLLGLAASIQMSAYQLVEIGDWIEIPKFGIDGNVEDISLNTMKIRNFDNSVSIVPTYMIITESFRNWRGMEESAGRRIKRSVLIDVNSVKYINDEEWKELKQAAHSTFFDEDRSATNLGTFQKYLARFMRMNEKVNHDQRIIARQLQPTEYGLPVEFYCFSLNKNLDAYENLQSEIMEEIFIILPMLGLKMYQRP